MSGSDSPSGQHEIPRTPKGLDLAADLVKQVITLSTAVTAFTATFAKNFSPSVNGALWFRVRYAGLGYFLL